MKNTHKCYLLLGILLFTLVIGSSGISEGFEGENSDQLSRRDRLGSRSRLPSRDRPTQQGPLLIREPRDPNVHKVPLETQEPNGQQRKKLNDTISTLSTLPSQVMGASLETAKELHKQWHAEDPNL